MLYAGEYVILSDVIICTADYVSSELGTLGKVGKGMLIMCVAYCWLYLGNAKMKRWIQKSSASL